ncbi:superoxide dismutase [Pedobacter hartonius]|uniref:Superoxide dismutase n=1 Tax=Pedobacter hartonius TaxID=425514 RepID=A0A1H4G4X2_9SPHI|nr:superoxide dismutase [Pedobacter hartonius]SEB04635.1 superoxide dismutase, Fe-Mn family [Pedobacter hartonius]
MEHNNRRKFLKNSLLLAAIPAISPLSLLAFEPSAGETKAIDAKTSGEAAPFVFAQVPLPYAYDALLPYIDTMTMEIHYTKHHATYVKNVKESIKAENLSFKSATDFFAKASTLSAKTRNNGGGTWNHNFFWQSMQAAPASAPSAKLKAAIDQSFGSLDQFKDLFSKAALGQFGSGWAWLINDKGMLKITSTPNQDNPLMDNAAVRGIPLLGLDVWEHAYYLKYQNKRNDYIAAWWNVVNWDAVSKRFV